MASHRNDGISCCVQADIALKQENTVKLIFFKALDVF
jgi:hypothetical protein